MEKEIEQYYRPLFLYIKKRVDNQLDAEDLTQEVFYKLAKSTNENVDNIKGWVYSIAKNTIIDYYRKKNVHTGEIDTDLMEQNADEDTALKELSNCIVPYVAELPEEYREIIELSELKGISQKQIAEELGLNYVTVRSKVQRGRKKLWETITRCCTVLQGGKGSIMDFECNEDCGDDRQI
ncbi:MAG: sigma-70 family RNA polymerase sigma factor [Saprospiraceae bacterium]|nr:sigma-70 family RNA polymerase sigma factor [Saprospiraceae bacterium]